MPPIFRNPLVFVSLALFAGGVGYNAFISQTSSTEVTVELVLSASDEVITDLVQISAYETYFPEIEDLNAGYTGYEQYGPIFPVDDRHNVFYVDSGVQAGFEFTVGGTEVGLIGTTGGGADARTLTELTSNGLVRLTVETDGAPEFFVQAASDPNSGTFEAISQGVPDDGQMAFLLPEGDWTFTALDDAYDQTLVVSVPRGASVDATLDLRPVD